jgi:hypothetical protein
VLLERVNGLLNKNVEDALSCDKWTTFNDDAEPCDFQPFVHSSDSYMFVYRRMDVPEVAFPPTIPSENLKLISTILKSHPDTERGKLATPFLYNNVGADPTCPVTRREVNDLRDELVKYRQENRTLRDEVNVLAQEMRTVQERIAAVLVDINQLR